MCDGFQRGGPLWPSAAPKKSILNRVKSFGGNINVKVDLSNYVPKTDLKKVTHVDTSNFALKTNLASLKAEVDKLDIDKLAPVPADLSKLSDIVKNDVMINWLHK